MAQLKRLRKSSDVQVAGVCAGIAAYVGVSAQTVRLLTLGLLFFSDLPVFVLYVIAAVALPKAAGQDERDVITDWSADGLAVTYLGAIAPGSVSWQRWLLTVGIGFAALTAIATVVLAALGWADLTGPWELARVFGANLVDFAWFGGLAAVAGLAPRPYTITVTHASMVVERPFRGPMRIDLSDVVELQVRPGTMILMLRDDSTYRLPLPEDPQVIEALRTQLAMSRERAIGHQVDLEQTAEARKRVEQVLASRAVENAR